MSENSESGGFFQRNKNKIIGVAVGVAALGSAIGGIKLMQHDGDPDVPTTEHSESLTLNEEDKKITTDWQIEAKKKINGLIDLSEGETIRKNATVTLGKYQWEIESTSRTGEVIGFSYPGVFPDRQDPQPALKIQPYTKIPQVIVRQGFNITDNQGKEIPHTYAYFECDSLEPEKFESLQPDTEICAIPTDYISFEDSNE